MYSTFMLPMYNSEETDQRSINPINPINLTRMFCNYADYSQPIFTLTGAFGGIGAIINAIEGESLDIALSVTMSLSSVLAWYRVRRLGEAKAVMDSVNQLKIQNDELEQQTNTLEQENDELKESNDQLNKLEKNLTNDINQLREVLGIVDTQNENVDQIQKKLLDTYRKLKDENEKYNKLNRTNMFLTADTNNDGIIDKNEQKILNIINLDKINADKNNDGKITMDEFLN
jgi:cell division protein FtsB